MFGMGLHTFVYTLGNSIWRGRGKLSGSLVNSTVYKKNSYFNPNSLVTGYVLEYIFLNKLDRIISVN